MGISVTECGKVCDKYVKDHTNHGADLLSDSCLRGHTPLFSFDHLTLVCIVLQGPLSRGSARCFARSLPSSPVEDRCPSR